MRRDGRPSNYLRAKGPRVLAMCIDWADSTLSKISIRAFGSNVRLGLSQDNRERGALLRCQNSKPAGAKCECAVSHVDDESLVKAPDDWMRRQVRG